jgi:predicted PurR-regulated permease PerM
LSAFEDKSFLLLVAAVSVAFVLIVWPFYGAILWGTAIAILFAPVYRRLRDVLRGRENLAAIATLLIILAVVIVPWSLVVALLARQAAGVYQRLQDGEIDFQRYLLQITDALPDWLTRLLEGFGITDFADVQERLAAGLRGASQFLTEQLVFVMLYLLFFLLRDGDQLVQSINRRVPLRQEQRYALAGKFTTVIRAMIKGTLVVAVVQGALGGLIFWLLGIPAAALWGAVMAILSLLPAAGAPIVWVPVSLYLLAVGDVWQGIVLIGYGALVIGLADNVLRPILVGKDTRIPDYIVLISTLGGLAIFGANGLLLGPVVAALFLSAWDIFGTAYRS